MTGRSEEGCDPKRSSRKEAIREDAIRIARQRAREHLAFDLQISQILNSQWLSRRTDIQAVERWLDLFGPIASLGRFFGVLRTVMSQGNPKLRSRAALALAGRVESASILERLMSETDFRVRANTIEALWGCNTPEAEAMFRTALEDPHHRVAVNAAYGLYLIDPIRHIPDVESFITHPKPGHRRAAAWLIRKTGDARNLSFLKGLVRDQSPEVRHTAFQTIGVLRTATAAAR